MQEYYWGTTFSSSETMKTHAIDVDPDGLRIGVLHRKDAPLLKSAHQLIQKRLLAQILHNLPSGTRALPGCTFHKALELDRAMFAREVNGSLAGALVAAEVGTLPDTPARVTAQKIGVAGGVAQRGPAGIVGADTREDTLQLLQAVLGIALDVRGVIGSGIGRRWRISGPSMSARIIDEQTT